MHERSISEQVHAALLRSSASLDKRPIARQPAHIIGTSRQPARYMHHGIDIQELLRHCKETLSRSKSFLIEAKHQWQARLALWQTEPHGHAYVVAAAERILLGADKMLKPAVVISVTE
ncbi:hypothetical protein ACN47E_005206 [Coniothyrium glycines]